ncbi:Six-hairpin glycosidase-like protein, partial [Blyttiomyces helicus]
MVLKVGFLASLSLSVVYAHVLPRQAVSCPILSSDERIDCGSVASSVSSCEASGCCWSPVTDGGPWCYETTPLSFNRPTIPKRADIDAFIGNYLPFAVKGLEANIGGVGAPGAHPGAVVAATSGDHSPNSGSQPDYYYHWSRDSSLVMRTLVEAYIDATTTSPDPAEAARLAAIIKSWISFEGGLKSIDTLAGTAASGDNIGEPKWEIDGTDFNQPWGRPQDDGPGLRAHTMTLFLEAYLVATGDSAYVKSVAGQIKYDLDYVLRHYQSAASVDLWEERTSSFFYTHMAQHSGLVHGSAFVSSFLRDSTTASQYVEAAKQLEATLENFWDGNRSMIAECFNVNDRSGRDIATILAVNHNLVNGHGVFTAAQDKVLQTSFKIAKGFRGHFQINRKRINGAPAIGRYLEDVYNGADGVNNNGAGAWLLAINAMAEVYYRAALELQNNGAAPVTSINQEFYAYLGIKAPAGSTLTGKDLANLVSQLVDEGDAYLDTLRFYLTASGSHVMTEQINPVTGVLQGAPNLTWSYASLITVARARNAILNKSTTPPPPTTTT